MKSINKNYKRGIAMIELIFALVIIAIVLMSAPMLINQASQSNTVALQQEAIAAISAHTNILLTKHWDEADANLSGGVAPILKTSFNAHGVLDFDENNTRQGLYLDSGRLTLYRSHVLPASSIIGSEGGDRDDIDDYHNTDNNISIYGGQNSTATTGDYVDVDLNINTQIIYIDDTPTTFATISQANNINITGTNINISSMVGTSNIKFVHVVLTTNNSAVELNKTITMDAFSCNLGTTRTNGVQY
jgi:hypothetical protein